VPIPLIVHDDIGMDKEAVDGVPVSEEMIETWSKEAKRGIRPSNFAEEGDVLSETGPARLSRFAWTLPC
jgi:hypothetical protein